MHLKLDKNRYAMLILNCSNSYKTFNLRNARCRST